MRLILFLSALLTALCGGGVGVRAREAAPVAASASSADMARPVEAVAAIVAARAVALALVPRSVALVLPRPIAPAALVPTRFYTNRPLE